MLGASNQSSKKNFLLTIATNGKSTTFAPVKKTKPVDSSNG